MRNSCPHCRQRIQYPLDEIQTIAACMRAVADLLIPETDLHVVDRDSMAALLGYLSDRNRQAQAAYFEMQHAKRDAANVRAGEDKAGSAGVSEPIAEDVAWPR